jgi:tetratricopeptide (TPR) repeat protein
MKKRSQRGTNDEDGAHEGTAQVPAPSIRTVNSVLHAHSKQAAKCIAANYKSKNGYNEALQLAEQADSIFKEAKNCGGEEFSPDLTTYTSLIDCYGRCGKYATALRCESLLDELKVLYKETSSLRYKPNFKTYTAVITAWSRVAARVPDAPRRVEALLDEMRQEDETYPNAQSYTAAIRCYARSKAKDKAKKALQVLMSMREEEKKGRSASRPTTRTYDAAIDCCSKALHEPTESIKIAFAILKTIELDENTTPSSTTYRSLISTVSLLPPSPERNQLAASVFNKAKNASCCSLDVVKTLRTCVDTDTMRECLEGRLDATGHFNYDQLPRSWSKNIA